MDSTDERIDLDHALPLSHHRPMDNVRVTGGDKAYIPPCQKFHCLHGKHWILTTIILGCCFLFVLAMQIHSRLHISPSSKISETETTTLNGQINPSEEQLREYKFATHINDALDTSVDPCEDFYSFSCGGWIDQNPIPLAYSQLSQWGQFSKLTWEIVGWFQRTLQKPTSDADTKPLELSKYYFRACVSGKLADDTLSKEKLTLTAEKVVDDLVSKVKKAYGTFSMPAFLGAVRNSLGLNYGFKTTVLLQSLEEIKHNPSLKIYGVKIESMNESVVLFGNGKEKNTDGAIPRLENCLTLKALFRKLNHGNITFSESHWRIFLQEMFADVTTNLNQIVFELEDINIATHFTDDFEREFWVSKVYDYLVLLQDNLSGRAANSDDSDESNSDERRTENIPNLSKFGDDKASRAALSCTLRTMTTLPHATSNIFITKQFSSSTKTEVTEMFIQIREAFKSRVDESELWTENTKVLTKEKADAVKVTIGSEDWIGNQTKVDSYYRRLLLQPSMSYIAATLQILRFNSLIELDKTVLDYFLLPSEWVSDATEVNAFNSIYNNHIAIPAGILRMPFLGYPRQSLNYGALGSTLGHEFTHGFDDTGRFHDAEGDLKDWMDPSSKRNFETHAKCFVKQVDNVVFSDISQRANGNSTLGENIADNGGIALAYRAYQNYVEANGEERPLLGSSYTPAQLFTIAYAQTKCTTYTSAGLKAAVKDDVHSPDSIRVIEVVKNFKEFRKIWNCPVTQTENQCELW